MRSNSEEDHSQPDEGGDRLTPKEEIDRLWAELAEVEKLIRVLGCQVSRTANRRQGNRHSTTPGKRRGRKSSPGRRKRT